MILKAGLTENKLYSSTDILGQLLGGMEKLAGHEDVDLSAIQPNLEATIHAIRLFGIETSRPTSRNLESNTQARKDKCREAIQKKYVDSVIARLEQRFSKCCLISFLQSL